MNGRNLNAALELLALHYDAYYLDFGKSKDGKVYVDSMDLIYYLNLVSQAITEKFGHTLTEEENEKYKNHVRRKEDDYYRSNLSRFD